jgi:hypothetical protein
MAGTILRRAHRQALLSQLLLLVAALRHHLVWGDVLGTLGPHALNALQAAMVLVAVWIGWRAAGAAAAVADDPSLAPREARRRSRGLLLLAVCVPPFLSLDAVNYVTRGRILAIHGQNPYVVTADQIGGDPILALGDAAWAGFPLPYGPLVACLQGAFAWLADVAPLPPMQQLWLGILLWKLLGALALLGLAAAARGIAALLGAPPLRAFVLVAWNPLLLLELVANAHNDSLLALGATLAVFATLRDAPLRSGVAWSAATLAKFAPLVQAPLLLAAHWRASRETALLWLAGAIAVALPLAPAVALLAEPDALGFFHRQAELGWQREPWLTLAAAGCEPETLTIALRAVLVLWIAFCVLRVWRDRSGRRLAGACATTLLATAALASPLFCPWYHAWWLPIALSLPAGTFLPRAASLVTLCAPASYVAWLLLRRLDAPHSWLQVGLGLVLPLLLAAIPRRR